MHQPEVFDGVEGDHPCDLRRRRFPRDEIVAPAGMLQEEPPVLDVNRDPAVAQRMAARIGVGQIAHIQNIARYIHHVDALHLRKIGHRAGGGTDAEADHQRVHDSGMECRGKIGEQLLVPLGIGRRGRHGGGIGDQAQIMRLAEEFMLQIECRLDHSLPMRDQPRIPIRLDVPVMDLDHSSEGKQRERGRRCECRRGAPPDPALPRRNEQDQ